MTSPATTQPVTLLLNLWSGIRYARAQARRNRPPSASFGAAQGDRQGRGVDRETVEAGERALAEAAPGESRETTRETHGHH